MAKFETVLDYIEKTKDITIREMPLTQVDSLILSQFSYLKFDHDMIPGIGHEYLARTIVDIARSNHLDNIYADERYRKNNEALFNAMLGSRRFNRMRIHSYVNEIDYDNESQFAAMTIEFEDGTTYLAFRGTDDSLVGWKEDLNLALAKPVPGQIKSVDYLNSISHILPDKFCVGGHSKGGNLAVFSAMYCDDETQDRIISIYNHDGPGMRNEILDDTRYQKIRDRILMTVPHSSIVGMLLVNFDNYRVVESKNIGIMQHDPFSWRIDGFDFWYAEGVKDSAAVKDRSINEWVMSLDQDQIQVFLDAAYDVMVATGVENLNELMADWKEVVPRVANVMKEMDPETKEIIGKIFGALLSEGYNSTVTEIEGKIEEIRTYTAPIAEKIQAITPVIAEKFAELKNKAETIEENIIRKKD